MKRHEMQVHQILPSLSPGDAIGNEALLMRALLRRQGYASEIFALHIHPGMQARPYQEYAGVSSPANLLIYHFSIGSEVSDFVRALPDRKVMIYHNITPSRFFCGINETLAFLLEQGREELASLSGCFDLALADSDYNLAELERAGYQATGVLPLMMDFSRYETCNRDLVDAFSDGRTNILFVGRISPNKKHDDLLRIFYYYQKIDPDARLLLPGGYGGCESYLGELRGLALRLGLSNVHFPGKVPLSDLVSYYMVSDLFLCMSEHEGFGVPLVESMFFGLPIIAFRSSAVPSTLGDAGVLVRSKKYLEIAELMHLVVEDPHLRERLVAGQKERLKAFACERVAARFSAVVEGFEGK